MKWNRTQNAIESASIVLHEAEQHGDFKQIRICEELGMVAFGFALREAMDHVGPHAREVALDGTCECTAACIKVIIIITDCVQEKVNTNSSGCELTALVAEFCGEGIPLGFIYTLSTNGKATPGAKGWILDNFLCYFARHCQNI
jgi:hypothetical protein